MLMLKEILFTVMGINGMKASLNLFKGVYGLCKKVKKEKEEEA